MKAVCAWCKKEMGRRDSAPETADLITHGICDACAARLIDQLGEPLKTYLDDLAVPVLVVDGAGNVHAGNRLARQCLEQEFPRQPVTPCGTAFSCQHDNPPGSCGHTPHCPTCAIRNAVLHTHQTGAPLIRQPAQVRIIPSGARMDLLISTQKAGELVLLRIDSMHRPAEPPAPA